MSNEESGDPLKIARVSERMESLRRGGYFNSQEQ